MPLSAAPAARPPAPAKVATTAREPRAAKNIHGSTVEALGRAVVAGRYQQGQTLPAEPLLCQELGVSRTILREAVKSLVAKGLISTGPKVGTRVLPSEHWNWFDPDVIAWQAHVGFTADFLHDLQDLRRVVEPAAARLAAQRATPEDRLEIEAAFAGMVLAVDEGGDYVEADLRFHLSLLRAGHNRMLLQVGRALAALLRLSFEMSIAHRDSRRLSLPLHRAIVDAVAARDATLAERAVLRLIDGAEDDIRHVLSRRRKPAAAPVGAPRRARAPLRAHGA